MKFKLPSKYIKIITATILLILSFLNFFLTYQKSQKVTEPFAWQTEYSAKAVCLNSGTAVIQISFTNKETSENSGMLVTVLDNQTGKTIDLGQVAPGATITGTIETGQTSLNANTVQFQLKWVSGSGGTDAKTSAYDAVQCESSVTPEPSPSETPAVSTTPGTSPSPSVTSEVTPESTVTASIHPSLTITPSLTVTVESTVAPTNTPQPSDEPSNTPQPSYTPQPTYTPAATYTAGPSPTPTEIIIVVNYTNTPGPTESGNNEITAVPTIPTAGVPVAWFLVLIPIALLTLGLVL